jgi:hypothetical protein
MEILCILSNPMQGKQVILFVRRVSGISWKQFRIFHLAAEQSINREEAVSAL